MPRSETNPNAVLKEINDKFIKLDGEDIKTSNIIIKKFIEQVLMKSMGDQDSLFKVLYSVSKILSSIGIGCQFLMNDIKPGSYNCNKKF